MAEVNGTRKVIETIGFGLLLAGFAAVLILRERAGKYPEYIMYGGAILYFSGRFVKRRP